VLPSSQKTNFGPIGTIILEVVPFHAYALFPALLPIFLNASWKSCSVRVFSSTCYFALITSVVSNDGIFDRGKWKNRRGPVQTSRMGGWRDDSHVAFGKKFPDESGCVRWWVLLMQQPVLSSPKFGVKSSHITSGQIHNSK
jgi:hypothetical protein